jgi:hypothetical protein
VKLRIDKRLGSLERVYQRSRFHQCRTLVFSGFSDAELERLEWVAMQVERDGLAWIETVLTPAERRELDALMARIVVRE